METVNRRTLHPHTLALMEAVAGDTEAAMRQTVQNHPHIPQPETSVLEGVIFALASVAWDCRPAGATPAEVAGAISRQATHYLVQFEAEARIGPPMGTA